MIAALIYVAIFEPVISDTQYNTKRWGFPSTTQEF